MNAILPLLFRQRIAVSIFFFIHGVIFASWASHIPELKKVLGINDAEIGALLLIMPLSSILGLAISGWLNRNFDNKPPLLLAILLQCTALTSIGYSHTIVQLGISLFLMALAFRIGGIAMNTQAVLLQKSYPKPINGSFHALWSLGGIVGVGLTTVLIPYQIGMHVHLLIVALILVSMALVAYNYLPTGDRAMTGSKFQFKKPEKSLVLVGMIVMLASFCEGGMFDWSSIYFEEVVHVELYTIGYFTFMICMTLSRWFMDKIILKIGVKTIFLFSSILISLGTLTAVIFPTFVPAMFGFSMVGTGIAVVFPCAFLLAGDSKKYATGMAISIVATYSIFGMLIGPPLIGFLSHAYGMRLAFLFIAAMGACILPVSRFYFKTVSEK